MAYDEAQGRRALLFFVLFSCFLSSCYGYQFVVGGSQGWVLNPSENYNQWAQRNRFQVNDTLLFRYNRGSDSVLVVNSRADYDSCNTANPIQRFDDGNSVFTFDRSGPFYLISGNRTNCDAGQKLIVVVLAVRNRPNTPPAGQGGGSPSSPPGGASPPATGSPSPAGSTLSPTPATGGPFSPAGSPSASPGTGDHGSGPSPAVGAPGPAVEAPGPAIHGSGPSPMVEAPGPAVYGGGPSPAVGAPGPAVYGGGPSPAVGAPGPSVSGRGPSPVSEAPPPGTESSATSPASGSPTTPGSTTSPAPGSGTPADTNSQGGGRPRSLAAPPCKPSILFLSFVLSVGLGGFMVSG